MTNVWDGITVARWTGGLGLRHYTRPLTVVPP